MPLDPHADIEISAYSWVPDLARGLVRDLRARWALEEAGLSYRVRLLDPRQERPADYLREQPFGQVPMMIDGGVHLFESGAIVLHIAERTDVLMPRDPQGRARTRSWVLAALNSIEPFIQEVTFADLFHAKADWAAGFRQQAEKMARLRLTQLSHWLGEKDHLEDRFTAGDLTMATILRIPRHTKLVSDYDNLARYLARCEARPAFQRALAAQLAVFKEHDRAQAI